MYTMYVIITNNEINYASKSAQGADKQKSKNADIMNSSTNNIIYRREDYMMTCDGVHFTKPLSGKPILTLYDDTEHIVDLRCVVKFSCAKYS